MIFMKAAPGAKLTGAHGHVYVAGTDGLISHVETHDIAALQAQGAVTTTVPHVKHLKLLVSHALYFEGATHKADADGILRDVPRDHAQALIESGAAREATDAELATPAPAIAETEHQDLAEDDALVPSDPAEDATDHAATDDEHTFPNPTED